MLDGHDDDPRHTPGSPTLVRFAVKARWGLWPSSMAAEFRLRDGCNLGYIPVEGG